MGTIETVKEVGKKWWKWTKITIWIVLILGLSFLAFILFANYSEGTRTGFVTKVSHKGYIFKTYEGELNFGFFGSAAKNGQPSDNTWYFSVINGKVADQVEKASQSGQKVTLHYKQKYLKISIRGDTEYMVYKVEPTFDTNATPATNQNQ